ncbi:MAG: glycosyltransferase [Candidatus Sulfotelmatobacter sp.]|jgi:glycosyltransferase involved in cell wall biosynthesis
MPEISVVIGVYEDWIPLDSCLRSLAEQVNAPRFEVTVVDDGSRRAIPDQIYRWADCFPLTFLRQTHAGIAMARNRGIQVSKGSILLFVDADCRLQPDCLAALKLSVIKSPQYSCFQLRVEGDLNGIVGRAEELRLLTLQKYLLQSDGCIRYLNTAGFAIRKSRIVDQKDLFKPDILRGEDTVLLAELMLERELPLFVSAAVVKHSIHLSLLECFLKDIRLAGLSRKADYLIAATGIRIRVNSSERLRMMIHMWKASAGEFIGRDAWFVVVARQGVQRLSSFVSILSRSATRVAHRSQSE